MEEKLIKEIHVLEFALPLMETIFARGVKDLDMKSVHGLNTQMWRKISLIEDWKNLKL